MKKVKKVLQNGFKYPQNSTRTVICDRIGRFDKIGRFENIRVRVRVSEKELQDGDKYKYPQNGCKYTPDSTTHLFSIDLLYLVYFCVLNALKFPKIVKNYYGAPPPPELERAAADDGGLFTNFFIFLTLTCSCSW